MSEIKNAKISGTMLGTEDHGCMCCWLFLDGGGWGCGFGGYVFDQYDPENKKRVFFSGYGLEFIKRIMETVGVEKWEDLKGKYIRAETQGIRHGISRIGNLIEDKWFDPSELNDANKERSEA